MNEAQVTMVGYVASNPRLVVTKAGRFVANMRVGMTPRRQDRETGQWSDGDTSYVTVTCWRSLASNVAACLRKGDPVVVKGRMRVRQFDDKAGNQRLAVEVDASTLGHDLTRGVAHFLRTKNSPGDAPTLPAGPQAAGGAADEPDDATFEPHALAGNGWAERPADGVTAEPWPGPSHDDDFSAADLFDDSGIAASSNGSAAGDEDDSVPGQPDDAGSQAEDGGSPQARAA